MSIVITLITISEVYYNILALKNKVKYLPLGHNKDDQAGI